MKGMRGRFLRKLKSISTITTLKQSLLFQVNSPNQYFETETAYKEKEHTNNGVHEKVLDSPSLTALVDDVEDEKDLFFETDDLTDPGMSNSSSPAKVNEEIPTTLDSEVGKPSTVSSKDSSVDIAEVDTAKYPSLLDFEEKCPPGGSESVVLYTTSMRGIRKTFEDCNTIRFLLENIRVVFCERDVSIDMGFREELWSILGGRVVPPKLFIKGRHIGGVDEVVGLHEQGKLRELLQGIPINPSTCRCTGCGGVRFVLCFQCNGSRKVKTEGQGSEVLPTSCLKCNENGLVKCHICC